MATGRALTSRQREIYEFICQKIEVRGFPPSIREIGEAFAIKSPNGVMCHLRALEKKGLIKRSSIAPARFKSKASAPAALPCRCSAW